MALIEPGRNGKNDLRSVPVSGDPLSFTRQGRLLIRGSAVDTRRVQEILRPFLSDDRIIKIDRVVAGRTRNIVTVVEGAANTGNVRAVMRTAEALGFFEFHVIAGAVRYKHSGRASQGAEKWLDTSVWESAGPCLGSLKERGYQIAVTSVHKDSVSLDAVDFSRPTALVLGNELEGVSAKALELADKHCRVDMTGFVESYNISVAAALCLFHAFRERFHRLGVHGDLDDSDRNLLTAAYMIRAVQRGEQVVIEQLKRDRHASEGK